MTLSVFPSTPGPVFPATQSRAPLLMTVSFGDGYQQETEDGINAKDVGTLDLVWDILTTAEKNVFEAFLTLHGGAGTFTYTIPTSGLSYTFSCQTWKIMNLNFGGWRLEATFNRAFNTG